jgi:hypothetical protein
MNYAFFKGKSKVLNMFLSKHTNIGLEKRVKTEY